MATGDNIKSPNTGHFMVSRLALLRAPIKSLPQALNPRYYICLSVLNEEAEKAAHWEASGCFLHLLVLQDEHRKVGTGLFQMWKIKPHPLHHFQKHFVILQIGYKSRLCFTWFKE